MSNVPSDEPRWTRRGFLLTAAALTVVPGLPADPAAAAAELPDFPADVALYRSADRNWVGEITADGLWACAPGSPDQVVAGCAAFYQERLTAYAARGSFPVNGSVEIRVTGLDDPADAGVAGARPPLLSALRPPEDHPEWDTAVWLDVLTLPGTPDAAACLREIERFLLRTCDGGFALTRVEWSKGWAYTDDEAWSDEEVLNGVVPAAVGPAAWAEADAVLDRLDPHRVYGNAFLDRLFAHGAKG